MISKTIVILLLTFINAQPLFASEQRDKVQHAFVQGVLENVLIKDSVAAQKTLIDLKLQLQDFKSHANTHTLNDIQKTFKRLITHWKAVEAVYVAGALDEDYLDHPRYIDFFHQANESIPNLVARALNGDKNLNNALFKNSTKSINALEYLLFEKEDSVDLVIALKKSDFRRIDAALIVLANIQTWLDEITLFYKTDKKFISNPALSIGLVVNALVDSSFKLANWRVGEAAGLVKKYQDKPSIQQLEYASSQSSMLAIQSILKTHRMIIDHHGEQDLYAIAKQKKAESELLFIKKTLDDALNQMDHLPQPIAQHLTSKPFQNLHKTLETLHNAYYFLLIDALGLNANIIDADGD